MFSLGLLFALIIGVSLGLLGGGGSTLAVPVFVYVMGYQTKTAICMSLLVVGVTSLFGSVSYWRKGQVNLKITFSFGLFAMLGAYLGARCAMFLSDNTQLFIFSTVMLLASFFMFRTRSDTKKTSKNIVLMFFLGFCVGILSGIVGVGGGFLIVPSLVILGNLEMKEAVGTSLIIIAMNAITGVLGYLDQVQIPWLFTLLFTCVAIVGIFIGSYFIDAIPQKKLKKLFAVFILAMGIFVLSTSFTA